MSSAYLKDMVESRWTTSTGLEGYVKNTSACQSEGSEGGTAIGACDSVRFMRRQDGLIYFLIRL